MALGTRDITLDVTIRARTADAEKAAAALKRIDEQSKHAGKSMEGMTGDAKILNAEIKKSEQTIKDLDKTLLEFGNDKSVRQRLRSERSWLNELRRLEKDIGSSMPSAGGGITLPGQGAMSLVGPAVAAALPVVPALGAMLGGAVAGATGTAALAAGILSASRDESVRAAAVEAGHNIASEFFGGGAAFAEPTVNAIHTIERAFSDMHIGDALAKVAPQVEVIAGGFADFGRNIMPGVNAALDRMAPYAAVAARGIADMGDALGDFLDEVTASPGTVQGLETLFYGVNSTVRILGESIHFLSDKFHNLLDNAALVSGAMEDLYPKWYPLHGIFANINDEAERMLGLDGSLHGTISKLGKEAVDPFGDYLHHAWTEAQRLHDELESSKTAVEDFWRAVRASDDADLAWEKSIDDLTNSVRENGRTLDIHTEQGRNNIQAVDGMIDAAREQYAQGKLTTQQYQEQLQKIIQIGVQAGLSRKQLETLVGKYAIDVVINVATQFTNTANRVLQGVLGAFYNPNSAPVRIDTGRPREYAVGGTTPAGEIFKVHKDELMFSDRSHYVATAAQARALSASGGGGSQNVTIGFAGNTDTALATLIQKLLRTGQITISSRNISG